jgi:hypothetical protein
LHLKSISVLAGRKRINKQAEQTDFKEDITTFVKIMNAFSTLSLSLSLFTLHIYGEGKEGLEKENYGNLWIIIQNITDNFYYVRCAV